MNKNKEGFYVWKGSIWKHTPMKKVNHRYCVDCQREITYGRSKYCLDCKCYRISSGRPAPFTLKIAY